MFNGPDIAVAGYAGEAGARMIAAARKEELRNYFREDYLLQIIKGNTGVPDAADFLKYGAEEVIPVGQGGVLASVYAMAKERKAGVRIELKKIPVLQSTIEICEYYGLNPYRLFCGAFILLTGNGTRLAENLSGAGIASARIGMVTEGPAKIITDKEETEYLNRPAEDEIFKILPDIVLGKVNGGL